jgi:phospholipid/cholesterol/gamma-HCH transport system permease protein
LNLLKRIFKGRGNGDEETSYSYLPEWLVDFFHEVGDLTRFTGSFFREFFRLPFENQELLRQSYGIGYNTLPLISITGFIMGLVLTIQTRPVLVEFGAQSYLPGMVSVSLIREIGPVVTALIFAGKVGSSMGAELGSMRVTEQIEAMEVSGTNPIKYIVVTRVLSASIMLPILVFYADAVALYGSYVGININGNVSLSLFFSQAFSPLDFYDFIPATIKTILFGFSVGIIGCYKGYYSSKGTEGVGKAANSAVVTSSLVIFVIDLIAVQLSELYSKFFMPG